MLTIAIILAALVSRCPIELVSLITVARRAVRDIASAKGITVADIVREEAARVTENLFDDMDDALKSYVRADRSGASFGLTRKERIAVFALIAAESEHTRVR
jgi:hypothetical protein